MSGSLGPIVPIAHVLDRTETRPARLARVDGCATVPLDAVSYDVRAPPVDPFVGERRFHWSIATVGLRFRRPADFSIGISP